MEEGGVQPSPLVILSTRQRPLLRNRFDMSKDHKSQSCFVILKVVSGPTMEVYPIPVLKY